MNLDWKVETWKTDFKEEATLELFFFFLFVCLFVCFLAGNTGDLGMGIDWGLGDGHRLGRRPGWRVCIGGPVVRCGIWP